MDKLKILAAISGKTEEDYLAFLVNEKFESVKNMFLRMSGPQPRPLVTKYPNPVQDLSVPPMPPNRQKREQMSELTQAEWDELNQGEDIEAPQPQEPQPENIAGKVISYIRGREQ